MAWRSVESLKKLKEQILEKWPNADKTQFGTIGDAAHQATTSDHNPEADGTVDAMDIPHQPEIGLDTYRLADILLNSRDKRIKYLISNRRIGGDENYAKRNNVKPWTWGPYNGVNPHDHHMHISVNDEGQDDRTPWKIEEESHVGWNSGRGSWYSQFKGKYTWVDRNDTPNSNALGVPDSAQGVAFYNEATLGKWFKIRYPNGYESVEQQTDIGPAPRTGRAIDISAAAADRAGYSPNNFPTDDMFYWEPAEAPSAVANLSPAQQAVAYSKLRGGVVVHEPDSPPEPNSVEEAFKQFREQQVVWTDWLQEHVVKQPTSNEFLDLWNEIKPVLMNNKGTLLFIISQLPLSTQAKLFRLGLSGGIPLASMETPMETKGFLQSKTIWGVIMMLAPTVAQLFGLHIGADDIGNAGQLIQTIIEAVGGLLAIYGRATATTTVSAAPIVKS